MTDTRTPLEVIREALEFYARTGGGKAVQALTALAKIEGAEPVCTWLRDRRVGVIINDHGYPSYPPRFCPSCGKRVVVAETNG